MDAKSKFLISFVLSLLFFVAVSCTTTNPPVNGTTGATKVASK
ncbi:MAG: hypothetical protein P4L34_13570 [Paludibacter sp.]|nr:hypothetical protein [Paludibacter sp.]